MAIGDPYVTLVELKGYLSVGDTVDDTVLTSSLAAASAGINDVCGRQFNDAGVASARLFRPRDHEVCWVDDFSTTVGLVVRTDLDADGVFEQTWTAADYELHPLNGVVSGVPGWPFEKLVAVAFTYYFPSGRRDYLGSGFGSIRRAASVQVTARWGWAAVPEAIKTACKITASELSKLKDAPFGVAGFDQYGAVRVRTNPIVMRTLGPYMREPYLMR